MKIMIIGPSPYKSKGGMATVIREIVEDKKFCHEYDVKYHESYVDGNVILRQLFSVYSYIRFLFSRKNYDVFYIHMASYRSTYRKMKYYNLLYKKNKKIIIHLHGGEFLSFYNNEKKNRQNTIKKMLHNSNAVIALSEKWRDRYYSTFGDINCYVVRNGIDTKEYEMAYRTQNEKITNIVCLAKVCKEKGVYDLIDAVGCVSQRNENIHCYIAGIGEIEKAKRYISRSDLDRFVDVVGWVDNNQKKELLAKCGILALVSYNEALPMSILEGLACGKAILATNVGAIPEVVSDHNGFLVEPGDINGITKALIELINYPEKTKLIQRNNRNLAKMEYDLEKTHSALSDILKKVIG